jgi:hypothetical protein
LEIYEIPDSVEEIFSDTLEGEGCQYRIVDYTDGMDMDNIQSMQYFLELVDIHADYIVEDEGTLVVLNHPSYDKKVAIHSGGLGDFFSHGFETEIAGE